MLWLFVWREIFPLTSSAGNSIQKLTHWTKDGFGWHLIHSSMHREDHPLSKRSLSDLPSRSSIIFIQQYTDWNEMNFNYFACLFACALFASYTAQALQPSRINRHHQSISSINFNEVSNSHDTITKSDSENLRDRSENSLPSWFAAVYFFAACTFSWCQPCPVLAETPPPVDAWTKNIASSLKAPTEDTPQIPLPVLSRPNNGAPVIMGSRLSPSSSEALPDPWRIRALVSLENPRIERPFANDFMVVQVLKERPPKEPYVITAEAKQNVLGGAKIPVGKTRFPSSISLGPENAKAQATWKELASKQDLWLEATICKEDSVKFPCAPDEQRYRGVALTKFFEGFPVANDGQGDAAPIGVRMPSALVLQRINGDD